MPRRTPARLGRTLHLAERVPALLRHRQSQNDTEAINGIIELGRCVARGFGNPRNFRLRMILVAGRLTQHPNLR